MAPNARAIENALQSISSRRESEALESLRNEPGESTKALGGSTNSMLLSSIQGECKRGADLALQQCQTMEDIKEIMYQQQEQMTRMESALKDLAAILASNSIKSTSHSGTINSDLPVRSKDFYYKGVKLGNRYHIYGCIISHLINMIYSHMQKKIVRYPDSVDCNFTDLVNAVRVVCNSKCSITSVEFGMHISASSKTKPAMESLYRHIASTTQSNSVTLPESSIGKIYNDSTREDIFVNVERVMQRLTFLHGILSPKQMDAMRSIKYPIVTTGDEDELHLNYDESFWTCGQSHAVTNSVMELPHLKKCVYIEQIMNGKSPAGAYGIAVKSEPTPKTKKS